MRIGRRFAGAEGAKVAVEMLRRTPKQLKAFQVLSDLCEPSKSSVITRETLMNEAHCTSDIVKRLVSQGFIETYEHAVDRLNRRGEAHPNR